MLLIYVVLYSWGINDLRIINSSPTLSTDFHLVQSQTLGGVESSFA